MSSTRTPTPLLSPWPSAPRRRRAPRSPICTSGPASAAGSSSAAPCTGAPAPAPGSSGTRWVQLDGPPCGCGNRGCVEALCLTAVARGDTAEAARVLGTAAGNLVALLDVDLVLLGGRTVAAAPDTFVDGVTAVLDARAARAGEEAIPVRLAPTAADGVAEGAAQLLLAPLFGRAEG
ncbi:putative NBD/HSP70 family sugar kinase [Streptomyces tendae]